MEALIARARAEKKWLYAAYHGIWFTPSQLEREQEKGKFRWAPENFRLRNPSERVSEVADALNKAQAEYERVLKVAMAES